VIAILGNQVVPLMVDVPHLGNQVVPLIVDVQHPDKVHQGLILFLQLELRQTLATREKRESFCADFHFSSNNVLHFFLRALNELSVISCQVLYKSTFIKFSGHIFLSLHLHYMADQKNPTLQNINNSELCISDMIKCCTMRI
jgi:hypothetical protein